ncbi:hypothetical protein FHG87_003573, partial [Trinorchestia longiramus]
QHPWMEPMRPQPSPALEPSFEPPWDPQVSQLVQHSTDVQPNHAHYTGSNSNGMVVTSTCSTGPQFCPNLYTSPYNFSNPHFQHFPQVNPDDKSSLAHLAEPPPYNNALADQPQAQTHFTGSYHSVPTTMISSQNFPRNLHSPSDPKLQRTPEKNQDASITIGSDLQQKTAASNARTNFYYDQMVLSIQKRSNIETYSGETPKPWLNDAPKVSKVSDQHSWLPTAPPESTIAPLAFRTDKSNTEPTRTGKEGNFLSQESFLECKSERNDSHIVTHPIETNANFNQFHEYTRSSMSSNIVANMGSNVKVGIEVSQQVKEIHCQQVKIKEELGVTPPTYPLATPPPPPLYSHTGPANVQHHQQLMPERYEFHNQSQPYQSLQYHSYNPQPATHHPQSSPVLSTPPVGSPFSGVPYPSSSSSNSDSCGWGFPNNSFGNAYEPGSSATTQVNYQGDQHYNIYARSVYIQNGGHFSPIPPPYPTPPMLHSRTGLPNPTSGSNLATPLKARRRRRWTRRRSV